MIPIYTVNGQYAPLNSLSKFKKWHRLACPDDPLTSEERYRELSGVKPVLKEEKEKEKRKGRNRQKAK